MYNLTFDIYSWLLQRQAMANTSTRVSRPEEEGVKRLVAMAGERDSGETCRWSPFYPESWSLISSASCPTIAGPMCSRRKTTPWEMLYVPCC